MKASQRLKEWIYNRVIDQIDFTIENEGVDTLEGITNYFLETGLVPVSNQYCENNIFNSETINVLFRVWHDYFHIKYQLPFNLEGESKAAFLQAAELPKDWHEEKFMIMTDIIGQTLYYNTYKDFPTDQKTFNSQVLETGKI